VGVPACCPADAGEMDAFYIRTAAVAGPAFWPRYGDSAAHRGAGGGPQLATTLLAGHALRQRMARYLLRFGGEGPGSAGQHFFARHTCRRVLLNQDFSHRAVHLYSSARATLAREAFLGGQRVSDRSERSSR
jgi:hypothetical protein